MPDAATLTNCQGQEQREGHKKRPERRKCICAPSSDVPGRNVYYSRRYPSMESGVTLGISMRDLPVPLSGRSRARSIILRGCRQPENDGGVHTDTPYSMYYASPASIPSWLRIIVK
jgi:hypothetical protein